MRHPKILVFSGSTRAQSYNTQLVGLVAKHLALADANVTRISLQDYEMPLYNGDLEEKSGVPLNARRLKELFDAHQGVFIASPEYNTSISPILKNALDWLSRLSGEGEPPAAAFKNKVFAVGAASPGQLAGVRGLINLRTILEIGLGALVIPEMATVAGAAEAFDHAGDLKNERARTMLEAMVKRLVREAQIIG